MTVPQQPPRPGHPPAYHTPPPAAHSLANYGPPPFGGDLAPPPLGAKKALLTPYLAVWSGLGLVAAGYLIFLTLSPESQLVPNSAGLSDQRFAARLANEVTGIKDSVAKVQLELAKVKTDLAGQESRGKMLGEQLTALERKVGGDASAGMEASLQERPPAAPVPKATPKAAAPVEIQADAGAAAPSTTDFLANADTQVSAADLGLETPAAPVAAPAPAKAAKAAAATKTVAAAADPIDFGTPVVKPAAKPVGVQISSGASVDSLRLSWSLLSDRHADALKNLEARYIAHGDEAAPTYDLIAGPIKSKSEAQKVCKALAARNVPCKVGDFAGEGL